MTCITEAVFFSPLIFSVHLPLCTGNQLFTVHGRSPLFVFHLIAHDHFLNDEARSQGFKDKQINYCSYRKKTWFLMSTAMLAGALWYLYKVLQPSHLRSKNNCTEAQTKRMIIPLL